MNKRQRKKLVYYQRPVIGRKHHVLIGKVAFDPWGFVPLWAKTARVFVR